MRNKRVILYEILFALEEGPQKITHLVYKVNTPPARLKQYLVELRKRELVGKIEGKDAYYLLTIKGALFCKSYRDLTTHLP